jgi:hypothetical protein
MHSFTLHCTLFQVIVVLFSESNPPCKFNNRGKVLQISKFGLNSNQGVLQKFSNKNQRKSGKEKKEKRKSLEKGKGQRLHIGPDTENSPWPISLLP